MEHDVYLCTWSRSPNGFVLWVKSRPHIRSEAPTYAEAEKHLIQAIQDSGGAMMAVLEFDPPLPKSPIEQKYTTPEIYLVCGDHSFETDAPRWRYSETAKELDERLCCHDAFFETPVCRKCRFTSGRRSSKPLTLTYAPSRYDGAFGSVGSDGGITHQLLSDEFLDLLTPEERRSLDLRSTIRRGRRKFHELVGPTGRRWWLSQG